MDLVAEGESGDVPQPQHCGLKEQVCRGVGSVTSKQRRMMKELAQLTGEEAPALGPMEGAKAGLWIRRQWGKWMDHHGGLEL